MPGTTSKNKRRLWIAAGLLLAALTVLLLLPGDRKDSRVAVNDGVGTIWITPIADLPVNSFARSDFIQDDAGTAYTGGAYTASQGVDVSEWQKEIQWQEVAAGGINFAVLRCGFRLYSDISIFWSCYNRHEVYCLRVFPHEGAQRLQR